MARRNATNATIDEERLARIAVIRDAGMAAGLDVFNDTGNELDRKLCTFRDLTAHEATIPAGLFVALLKLAERARTVAEAMGAAAEADSLKQALRLVEDAAKNC